MFFDDGANPYKEEEERIITFFKGNSATSLMNQETLPFFSLILLKIVFRLLS